MMIFIGGVHGVGKSFFCDKLLEITGMGNARIHTVKLSEEDPMKMFGA